jgi:tetratricopeptide (TPR) repeat protein
VDFVTLILTKHLLNASIIAIDNMGELQDHYQTLRLNRNATQVDIKRAFRLLARQYHPDLNPNNAEAAEKFRRITKAYETLSNPIHSSLYDDIEPTIPSPGNGAISQDCQKSYIQAVNQASQKNYVMALSEFTRAINLNPQYLDAYLGRAQVKFSLGDDLGVVEDCHRVLGLKPDTVHAQYLLGRAYHRLGDVRAAIDGYSQAIVLVKDNAKAYYNRGLAHLEIQEQRLGVKDLQSASRLFRKQNNISAYRRTRAALAELSNLDGIDPNPVSFLWGTVKTSLVLLPKVLINPGTELLASFSLLNPLQTSLTGLFFAIFALGCAEFSLLINWLPSLTLSVYHLAILGFVWFVGLWMSSAIARSTFGARDNWSSDVFLAGAALLPIGVGALLSNLSVWLGPIFLVILAVFTLNFKLLTLYSGCTQLHNLSEQTAAIAVPSMVLISSGLVAFAMTWLQIPF